jgi:hypothetical protein
VLPAVLWSLEVPLVVAPVFDVPEVVLPLLPLVCAAADATIATPNIVEKTSLFMPSSFPLCSGICAQTIRMPLFHAVFPVPGIPHVNLWLISKKEIPMKEDRKRPAEEPVSKSSKVVDDAQASRNEAQQSPANSGDRRTSNAVGIPLPWGAPSDDLHPITQPQGDVSDPTVDPPGAPHIKKDQSKRSA